MKSNSISRSASLLLFCVMACALGSLFSVSGSVQGHNALSDQDPAWQAAKSIFDQHCKDCHNQAKKRGGLSLETPRDFWNGGDSGPAAKEILKRVNLAQNEEGAMPPKGARLTGQERETLEKTLSRIQVVSQEETHWSLKPVKKTTTPDRSGGIIDRFVFERLAREGLSPSGPAPRSVLIKRLKWDLLGLPPTPAEVAAFEADTRPDAFERLVDQWLDSPHFGERWARHWLDVVRFAESDGFETNQPRPNAWVYRDWVIEAINRDLPYDQFVTAQIAGEQTGQPAGTGFLVGGPWDRVKSPDETLTKQQRADELHDMVSTTTSAFLGLTGGCARCHSHKFDPIPQGDYYRIKAVFDGVIHGERSLPVDPDRETRRQAILAEVQSLENQLDGAIRRAHPGKTIWIYPTRETTPTFQPLVPPLGIEPYASGKDPGYREAPGDLKHWPTLGKGYAYWKGNAGKPLAVYRPNASGMFRIGFSWGAGWQTHTSQARLVLDKDGNPATTNDQSTLATVDQKRLARVGETKPETPPGRPLWSGLLDLGPISLEPGAALVVFAGPDDAYTTADLLVLQEISPGQTALSLRPAVVTGENRERFTPVFAKRLRIEIGQANQSEVCLDEVELFGPQNPGVNLAPRALRVQSSGDYAGNPFHKLSHINDGIYGNERSWIASATRNAWVEFEWEKPQLFDEIRWSRDRSPVPQFRDRVMTKYRILVSRESKGPFETVADSNDRVDAGIPTGLALSLDSTLGRDKNIEEISRKWSDKKTEAARLTQDRMGYLGRFEQPGPTRVFHRGDPMSPGEPVPPGGLTKIGVPFTLDANTPESQRRLALAKWVASRDNPLTARVMVNRLWQHHFGTGIVATPSDFGRNGARPSHPELLDWLAAELMEPTQVLPGKTQPRPWSLKHIHRLILTSATYRQSSEFRPDGARIDAQSRLMWRYPPRRKEAESIRDSILFVSGNLSWERGGPGFDLFEPNTNYVKVYKSRTSFGPQEWRRMIYQNKPRMRLDNVFGGFDCPDGGQITPMRYTSTTPLQSLALLNSEFMVDQSQRMAQRVLAESGPAPADQVKHAFSLAYQRFPTPEESKGAIELTRDQGLSSLCRALLASNEFLYVD